MSVEEQYPSIGIPRLTAATKAVFGDVSFQPNEQGYQAFLGAITAFEDLNDRNRSNKKKIQLAAASYRTLTEKVGTLDTPKLKRALDGFNNHFFRELSIIHSDSLPTSNKDHRQAGKSPV